MGGTKDPATGATAAADLDSVMTESPPLDLRAATISDGEPAAGAGDAPGSGAMLRRPIIVTPSTNVIKKIADAQSRRGVAGKDTGTIDWTQVVIPDTGEKVSTLERVMKGALYLTMSRLSFVRRS